MGWVETPLPSSPITCRLGLLDVRVLISFQRGTSRPQRVWPRVTRLGQGRAAGCPCVAGAVTAVGILSSTSSETGATSSQGTPRATAPWRNSCTITRRGAAEPFGETLSAACSSQVPFLGGGVGDGAEYPGQGCPPPGPHAFLGLLFPRHPWALSAGSWEKETAF